MTDNIKTRPTAVIEMERLRGAHAWSPAAKVVSRWRNGAVARYTFEDLSMLAVYLNGDAAWFHRDDKGNTDGWQRWPAWHNCNHHGR